MKKSVLLSIFAYCSFSLCSAQNQDANTINIFKHFEKNTTNTLSRFLQPIKINESNFYKFNGDFLRPTKDVSLNKMLNTPYYKMVNSFNENAIRKNLYPNINYPNGILINNNNFMINPIPEVNTKF